MEERDVLAAVTRFKCCAALQIPDDRPAAVPPRTSYDPVRI